MKKIKDIKQVMNQSIIYNGIIQPTTITDASGTIQQDLSFDA